MKDHGALKEALKRRKSNGVDVTIVLGANKPDGDKKQSDDQELAPEVKDLPQDQSVMMGQGQKPETPHDDEAQDKDLIQKMLAAHDATEDGTNTIGGKARALMRSKLKK